MSKVVNLVKTNLGGDDSWEILTSIDVDFRFLNLEIKF